MEFSNNDLLVGEQFLKPIYPSKKEDWTKAYYVGLRPYTLQKYKSEELIKIYVFANIEWYCSEHSYYPLITTLEFMANYLRISDDECKRAVEQLVEEDSIMMLDLGEDFLALYPKY